MTSLLLLAASWLAYRGAPAVVIVVVAALLALPRFIRDQNARDLSGATAFVAVNALLFSALAYGIGAGVSYLLST